MAGCFTVSTHVVLDRITFQMCLYFPSVKRISPDRVENPKKGPKIFTESNIKISGTQNIERFAEGARHIFMPNHSQVRRVARNDHAELCTLYPLASTKAAWQPFFLPLHKNINQSCSNMMTRATPATECGSFRVWVISQPVEGTPPRLMQPVSQSGDSLGFRTSKEKKKNNQPDCFSTTFNSLTASEVELYIIFWCLIYFFFS